MTSVDDRRGRCAGKAAAEDALRPTRKQAAPAEPGSSSLGLRCAPGYRAAIFQVTDDKHYDLWSMYAAARDSLALGLRSRARECGYAVDVVPGYGSPAATRALDALGYGDVAIFVGEAKELQFASDACDRDARGVHAILYQTEPRPRFVAPPGIDEVWHYAKSLAASAPRPPTARGKPLIVRHAPPGFVRPPGFGAACGAAAASPGAFLWMGRLALSERRACYAALERNELLKGRLAQRYDVWTDAAWDAVAPPCASRRNVFVNFHKRCDDDGAPLEVVRLAQLLSRGAVVVSQRAHAADMEDYADLVLFEPDFFAEAWSPRTAALLGDADALEAFRAKAAATFEARFDPRAILERAGAWNATAAPRTATAASCASVKRAKEAADAERRRRRRDDVDDPDRRRGDLGSLAHKIEHLRGDLKRMAPGDPARSRLEARVASLEERRTTPEARRRRREPPP